MESKKQVLDAMKKEKAPVNTGRVVEITGLDRKIVEKAMTELKADGSIVSPKRCFWQPK